MARARKTPKPKMPAYDRIDRDVDPLGAYAVLDEAMDKFKKELVAEKCRIALAWRHGWKRNKDQQLMLGKCKKVSELDKLYEGFDFIVILNNEAWKILDADQRLALIHHELCHAAIAEDQNGNTKKDARNRTMFRTRKHDIEEFGEVIEHHGCYLQDIENLVATAMRSKKPPAPTLLGMIDEPAPKDASVEPSTNGHAEPLLNGHATHEPAVPKSRTKGKPKSRAA